MEKALEVKVIPQTPHYMNETKEEFNATLEEAYQQSLRGEGVTKEELMAELSEKYGFEF